MTRAVSSFLARLQGSQGGDRVDAMMRVFVMEDLTHLLPTRADGLESRAKRNFQILSPLDFLAEFTFLATF